MASLVACLGSGKGTWIPVLKLAEDARWEKVFLIVPQFFKDSLNIKKENIQVIIIDDNKGIKELSADMKTALDGKLLGDVGINFFSGSGKEHMALISALLKLGVGIRFVALTQDGIVEL